MAEYVAAIREARAAGMSVREIALKYELSVRHTQRVVAGWTPKGRLRKKSRDMTLLHMFEVQPALSLTNAGRHLGITRERVRQVLAKHGQHVIPAKLHLRKRSRLRRCKKDGCNRLCSRHKRHCSECGGLQPYICQQCGEVFYRLFGQVENQIGRAPGGRRDGPFCSNRCAGLCFGKRYGWGNPTHPVQQRKRFHDALFQLVANGKRITIPIKTNVAAQQNNIYTMAHSRGLRIRTRQHDAPDGTRMLQVWLREARP